MILLLLTYTLFNNYDIYFFIDKSKKALKTNVNANLHSSLHEKKIMRPDEFIRKY